MEMDLDTVQSVINTAYTKLSELGNKSAVLRYQKEQFEQNIIKITQDQEANFIKLENMRLAASILQKIVDVVSRQNIARIEHLVNSALTTIFDDMNINFKINQDIKRNTNTYRIVLESEGLEGSRDSYGGGVVAVVAFILKIISNMLCKGYPMVALDESLSFLSSKYIGNASGFIRELSEEFKLVTLLVTHQPQFVDYTDAWYDASNGADGVQFTKTENIHEKSTV